MMEENIKILTYNLSWESMTGNKNTWHLCNNNSNINNKRHFSNCINNISDVFNDNLFDFITLQEASNFEILIKNNKNLQHMKYLHHKSGREDMVTLWNPNKYKLLNFLTGEFQKGRPWQYLNFENNLNLINVHLPHYTSRKEWKYNFNNLINNLNLNTKHRTIICGDFNYFLNSPYDNDNKNNKIKLGNNIYYFNKFILPTCCILPPKINMLKVKEINIQIDFILDNYKPLIDIFIPKVKKLASDHRPLVGILNNKINYYKKYKKYKNLYLNLNLKKLKL